MLKNLANEIAISLTEIAISVISIDLWNRIASKLPWKRACHFNWNIFQRMVRKLCELLFFLFLFPPSWLSDETLNSAPFFYTKEAKWWKSRTRKALIFKLIPTVNPNPRRASTSNCCPWSRKCRRTSARPTPAPSRVPSASRGASSTPGFSSGSV